MPLPRLSNLPPRAGSYTPAGSMNQWITLLQPGARNGDGTDQPFSPFATLWASVRALHGQELLKAQQIVQEVTHLVAMPYLPGVTQAMRIGFAGRVFQIQAVEDPDERQIELRVLCVEREQNA